MKRILGMAILAMGLSVPTHAQAMSAAGNIGLSGGGGSTSASGGVGGSGFGPLAHIPPAHFNVLAVSGTATDFEPSAFLPFKQAVAAGRAAQEKPQSIVEAAAENKTVDHPKAKFEIVQDDSGKAVIARR